MLFFLPLLASLGAAGATAYGDWRNKKRQEDLINKFKPPEIDFGQRRANLAGEIGTERNAAARGAEASMASRGLNDSGMMFSAGRAGNMDAARNMQAGLAGIEAQEQAAKQQRAQWDWQKAQALGDTGVDWLGAGLTGLGTFTSLYPMFNPKQFMPDFSSMMPQGQGQAQPQGQGQAQLGINKIGGNAMPVQSPFTGQTDIQNSVWYKMLLDRLNNMKLQQQVPQVPQWYPSRWGD